MSQGSSLDRRSFLKMAAGGVAASFLPQARFSSSGGQSAIFSVTQVPETPILANGIVQYHVGVERLLQLMAQGGLYFYRTAGLSQFGSPAGLIAADDVVLIKVNGQWKYRGSTNTDLVRGIIQRILNHPDGFRGEVVMIENGQGRGSLANDVTGSGYPDGVHANAVDETQSFQALIDRVFRDPRVSGQLMDPYRYNFLGPDDHATVGYRRYENVSYPCFNTARGRRVELREGIWSPGGYGQNLKLINVPVFKTHEGSEVTASLKHFYGMLSMADGMSDFRHYGGLGETTGKMVVSVRTPALNILDAIWVSHGALQGYPASATFNARRIAASQDPVALDYWACKNILYPYDRNERHNPDNAVISGWLDAAAAMINGRGGLYKPDAGVLAGQVTRRPDQMLVIEGQATDVGQGMRSKGRRFLG